MRRDQLEVGIHDHGWIETGEQPVQPTLSIASDGRRADLRDRLTGHDDELLAAAEIDVAFRYQAAVDDAEAIGALGVTNRTTGAYILEATTEEQLIDTLTAAAARYAEETDADRRYTLQFRTDRGLFTSYHKRTLLVYAQNRTLLRHRSLIPTGIEI